MDAIDGIVAVGIRRPAGVALVNAATGRERRIVRLPGRRATWNWRARQAQCWLPSRTPTGWPRSRCRAGW